MLIVGKYDEAKKCFRELIGETENSQYAGVYKLYEEGENPYSDLFKPGGDESSEMIFAIQNIGGIGQDFVLFYMEKIQQCFDKFALLHSLAGFLFFFYLSHNRSFLFLVDK